MSHQPSKSNEEIVEEFTRETGVMLTHHQKCVLSGIIFRVKEAKDAETKKAMEEERKRIAFEITQIPRVSGIGAIPETNDYANGWNDCRKKAGESVVIVLQIAYSKALTPPDVTNLNK